MAVEGPRYLYGSAEPVIVSGATDAEALSRALEHIVGESLDQRSSSQRQAVSVHLRAESADIAGLVRELMDHLQDEMLTTPGRLLDLTVDGVLPTEQGWRAWGIAQFVLGAEPVVSIRELRSAAISTRRIGRTEISLVVALTAPDLP